jgi:sugar O-acyltransferase (sialic acid O-acetyltransferase NeuD family)
MMLLYGSGGHAKVVLECLESEGKKAIGFFDDQAIGALFKEIPVLGTYQAGVYPTAKVIVTIGNNAIRKKVANMVTHPFGTTSHSQSLVSPTCQRGDGTVILQGAIVQADAWLGEHVIVNTRAVVEHDCVVEDFVHIGPGAVLCGLVQIGEGTWVGANAVVAPTVKVGKWCQISAGSSVLEDVPDYSLVMGVPGKVVKSLLN